MELAKTLKVLIDKFDESDIDKELVLGDISHTILDELIELENIFWDDFPDGQCQYETWIKWEEENNHRKCRFLEPWGYEYAPYIKYSDCLICLDLKCSCFKKEKKEYFFINF